MEKGHKCNCGSNVVMLDKEIMLNTQPPKWFHECVECKKGYLLPEKHR